MLLKALAGLALASLAIGAIIPRADSFPCGCPTLGPAGTCLLTKNPFLSADQPGSAVCGTKGFNYVCNGDFNSPNCVRLLEFMQVDLILTILGRLRAVSAWKHAAERQDQAMRRLNGTKWNSFRGRTSLIHLQFCSGDSGGSFHVCAPGEAPFIPPYQTSVTYSGSDSAAVVASGDNDLSWLHDTLPSWFSKTCYGTSCRTTDMPSANMAYPAQMFGLTYGTLTLGITEAQFDSPEEQDAMIKLATLAVIRGSSCEDKTWKEKCTKYDTDCSLEHITICHGPSDVNIQMKKPDGMSFIHFQLSWDDRTAKLDCSVLEQPFSLAKDFGDHVPGVDTLTEKLGVITSVCDAIENIFSMASGKPADG
jgi:hypothetical protein